MSHSSGLANFSKFAYTTDKTYINSMQIYKKYLTFHLVMPILIVAFTLTGIVWLSQSLRFIDLIINKGLDVSTFLYLSLLLIPSLLVIILPVSLFVSVMYIYNKLTSESELLVLKSAGISRLGLAVPALTVAGAVTLINYLISFYILPASYREFKNMQEFIRNNYASVLLQEGVFSTPIPRFTVYIESRDKDGTPRGILVHDARNADSLVTYIAQSGSIVQDAKGSHVNLINGNIQKIDKKNGNLSLIYFDSYPVDLSVYVNNSDKRLRVAEERYIGELLFPQESDPKLNSRLVAEGHHRIVWPFLSLTLTIIGLAVLFSGQLNRRGQWKRIVSATILILIIVIIHLALKSIIAERPYLKIFMYANAILPTGFCLYIITSSKNINLPELKLIKHYLRLKYSRLQ
jgi:lipopolysaccharide export system permease protein